MMHHPLEAFMVFLKSFTLWHTDMSTFSAFYTQRLTKYICLQKYKVHISQCYLHISLKDWYTGFSPSWHHHKLIVDVWWCHSQPVHRVYTFFDDLFLTRVRHINSQSIVNWACMRTLILDRTMSVDMRSLKHSHASFHLSKRSYRQDLISH